MRLCPLMRNNLGELVQRALIDFAARAWRRPPSGGATAGHRAGDKHKKEVFFPAVLPLLHHGHLKICKCVKRLTLNIIIQGDQKIMKRLLKG